mmetsp:Transcript_4256/g.10713  ORF Transcript_4256/g.10713 Transcript_4256/m.10713 type:complete len:306 (-) Transcript_4256:114-1031(-)
MATTEEVQGPALRFVKVAPRSEYLHSVATYNSSLTCLPPAVLPPPEMAAPTYVAIKARTAATISGEVVVVSADFTQSDGSVVTLPSLTTIQAGLPGSPSRSCPEFGPHTRSIGGSNIEVSSSTSGDVPALVDQGAGSAAAGTSRSQPLREVSRRDGTLEDWVKARLANILGMHESLRTFSLSRADRVDAATSRNASKMCVSDEDEVDEGPQKRPSARQLVQYSYVKTMKRLASEKSSKAILHAASVAEEYLAESCELAPLTVNPSPMCRARTERASTGLIPDVYPSSGAAPLRATQSDRVVRDTL